MVTKRDEPITPQKAKKPVKSEDVALVCGQTQDGKGLHIIRKREETLESGVLQPLQEGKPIHGELVQLRPRGEGPLCDVEVLLPGSENPAATAAQKGPGQVANEVYRKNWDSIYSRGRTKASRPAPNKKLLN